MTEVPRRVCLSVPGGDARKLAKAAGSGADEVVLDLEDAVPPAGKGRARALVAETLAGWTGGPVAVRVNAVGTPWCHRDIDTCMTRAMGVQAIDGPYLGVADDEPLRTAATLASELGFDGKWVIHPRQVDSVRAAFVPSAAEVAEARAVLAALAEAAEAGVGAVTHGGRMVDEALAAAARRVLTRASAPVV